ncbi:cdmE, partial [Symbiodinium natans]
MVKHNGKTSHLTFPERKAEADLMYQCIDASNVAFGEINYAAWWQRRKPSTWDMDPNRARAKVEAHGTGTTIGDATEAHALQDVFGMWRKRKSNPVLVGSVKANVGHLEASAGMAGLLAVLAVFRRRAAAGNAELRQLSPFVAGAGDVIGLEFPIHTTPLTQSRVTACCNSFGFAGTIGTAVLASPEPPSVTRQVRHRIAFVFALSADLPKLLEEKEGCRSLLQSASYPAVVQRLVKNMPVAVDAIALTKVLLGQGECPEQLKSTACAVFQLCLASLWKVHGVQPALRQHLVVRARCRYEVSAKVVAAQFDMAVVLEAAGTRPFQDAVRCIQAVNSGAKVVPGARAAPELFASIGQVCRSLVFDLSALGDTGGPQTHETQVDYNEAEFGPSTIPFQELDSLQWATFTSLLRSRFRLRDIAMDATVAMIAQQLQKTPQTSACVPQEAAEAETLQALTSLEKETPSNTLIGVHGIDGDPMSLQFKTLAMRLSGEVAMYALKVTPLVRGTCSNLEDLAKIHVETLVARFGYSSYNIYGHSFGAMVAHKMAELLELRGVAVTLFLGDFEVAYPPERFMESPDMDEFTDRCRMGSWEGPEMEAYKILLRRHMFAHREDAQYCRTLLKEVADPQRREHELKGFVLTKARPSNMPMETYFAMINEFAANMGFHEKLVMESSKAIGSRHEDGESFYDWHTYQPGKLPAATLFVSNSKEFSCCVEVNKQFYAELDVVPVLDHEHYNLLESQ